jgi:hypothetical protein
MPANHIGLIGLGAIAILAISTPMYAKAQQPGVDKLKSEARTTGRGRAANCRSARSAASKKSPAQGAACLQHLVGDRGRSRYAEEFAATANAHFFLLAIFFGGSEAQRRHETPLLLPSVQGQRNFVIA